jgi:hypothetical protein
LRAIESLIAIAKHIQLQVNDFLEPFFILIRDAPDTVFAGYPAGRISG